METTASPVAIVADPAALIAQLAALDAIAVDCRDRMFEPGTSRGRLADLSRAGEAARAASSALFNFCTIAAIHLEETPLKAALDSYITPKSEKVSGRG